MANAKELLKSPENIKGRNKHDLALRIVFLSSLALGAISDRGKIKRNPEPEPLNLPPSYSLSVYETAKYPHPEVVKKARDFILSLQPEGSYILSKPGENDISPMASAHAAIALTKVGKTENAKGAINWLLARSSTEGVDKGSVYEHYRKDGTPIQPFTRGRGEETAMVLIALDAISAQDPNYLLEKVEQRQVREYARNMVDFLTSSQIQAADGRFYHRPDYKYAFREENMRMIIALQLATKLFLKTGDLKEAEIALKASQKGAEALFKDTGYTMGMPYDVYAEGIWGFGSLEERRSEIDDLSQTGFLTQAGVRNWDQQEKTPVTDFASLKKKLKYWSSGKLVGLSPSWDLVIALLTAGYYEEAVKLEQKLILTQNTEGGFSTNCLPYLLPRLFAESIPVCFTSPTVDGAARAILAEGILIEATAQHNTLAQKKTTP